MWSQFLGLPLTVWLDQKTHRVTFSKLLSTLIGRQTSKGPSPSQAELSMLNEEPFENVAKMNDWKMGFWKPAPWSLYTACIIIHVVLPSFWPTCTGLWQTWEGFWGVLYFLHSSGYDLGGLGARLCVFPEHSSTPISPPLYLLDVYTLYILVLCTFASFQIPFSCIYFFRTQLTAFPTGTEGSECRGAGTILPCRVSCTLCVSPRTAIRERVPASCFGGLLGAGQIPLHGVGFFS